MRAIAVMLGFAAAFGAAALWQSHRIRELEARRETAARIQDGEWSAGPSGLIEAGWANVVVGRPSGVDPIGDASRPIAAPETASPVSPAPLTAVIGDFELIVESGQTLSEIARAHYGTAATDLVKALARYNALESENALRAGQKLRLPALDRLER